MMYSAVRIASATIVRVELTGAGPTKLLPPTTNRVGLPWTAPKLSTTLSRGLWPMRHVPMWWLPE